MIPLIQLFQKSPPYALSLLVCLATSLWSARLIRRTVDSHERFLVGFVGLIAVYEGFRILKDAGVKFAMAAQVWADFSTLVVSLLFLLALLVLKIASRDHRRTREHLRLVEATDSLSMAPSPPPTSSVILKPVQNPNRA
jgi:hypothetical protein